MKLRGRPESVKALEELFKGKWGVSLLHDGGERFERFGQEDLRSEAFYRSYLIHVEPGLAIATEKAIVKFFYDHRTGYAEVYIPKNRLDKLMKRMPGAEEVIGQMFSDGKREPMVRVKRLDSEGAELEYCCPRCNWRLTHKCETEEGKE